MPDREPAMSALRKPGEEAWHDLIAPDTSEELEPSDQQSVLLAGNDARIARDELKGMLLASLQMQHVVVLAGSGCSCAADGPSMSDLWRGAVGDPPRAKAAAVAAKVGYDLGQNEEKFNIEELLSRVEAFLQVHQDAGDVQEFLTSSKKIILAECSNFLKPEKLGPHKTFIHRLSRRRVRDQRLQVFTTNYDRLFERAAAELGGVALDGFSFTAPRRYDPRFFCYDIIRRPRSGDDLGHYLEGVFLLYKLHGSVNWARGSQGDIYEKERPTPEEACLIYPATGKYQQSFLQPHLESMAQYLAAVREPNTCVLTVGVGFNDDHLSEPLLAAVQSNPHLRLIVADLRARHNTAEGNDYWKKFSELSSQGDDVWFINASFSDFVQMIPDLKSLTPAELLMKAVKGVTRGS